MNNKKNDTTMNSPAKIRYTHISAGQFSDEVVVQLDTPQQSIVGIFPSHFIDEKSRTVQAMLVQQSDDAYLVALPSTTFTTSSNVWFLKEKVIFEGATP
jgi:hypothetical protein